MFHFCWWNWQFFIIFIEWVVPSQLLTNCRRDLFLILEQILMALTRRAAQQVALRIDFLGYLAVGVHVVHWTIGREQIAIWNFGRIVAVKIAHGKRFFVLHVFFYSAFSTLFGTHWRTSFIHTGSRYWTVVLCNRKFRTDESDCLRDWNRVENSHRGHVLLLKVIIIFAKTRFFGIIDLWRVSNILQKLWLLKGRILTNIHLNLIFICLTIFMSISWA